MLDKTPPVAPPPTKQDTAYAWYVSLVMCLGFTFSYMDRSILPLLVQPLEHSFGLNDTTISLLHGAAFAVFYATFGFPLSRIADNGNRRNLILVGVVVWCLATAGSGLAQNVPQLFLSRIVVAIGEAVLAPAAVSIIADYFTPKRRTRALSIYSMGTFFGGGLSLGLGGTMLHTLGVHSVAATPIGPLDSWRIVFIVLGLTGLILAPLLLAVKEPTRLADHGGAVNQRQTLAEVLAVFVQKRGALFAVIVGFATIALGAQTLQSWAPTLFVRVHGWNLGGAGQRLGAFTIVLGPLGAICGALLADRLERAGRRDGKLIVGVATAVAAGVTAFVATLEWEAAAFSAVVTMQFLVAFNFGLVQAALAELLPNRMRAFGSACYVAASNLLAATLGPLVVGVLNDHVFHDPNMIAISLRIASPVAFAAAALILALGLRPYRAAVHPA